MFENLKNQLLAEKEQRLACAKENFGSYLTKLEAAKVAEGKKTVEDFAVKLEKKACSYPLEQLDKLAAAEACNAVINEITITVEWKKSRMWGNNPTAELKVWFTEDGHFRYNRFVSESISGCGYDKESTATAQVLNQVTGLLKEMYAIKDAEDVGQRECLGYGSGYGVLPAFEGGVGVNCHIRIMEKLGFTYEHVASGKTFDVYTFRRGAAV